MSTHKHIDRICVAVTALMLLITVLFMNGASLGIEMIIDEDTELHAHTVYFTANDLNSEWNTSGASVITLSGDSGKISGKGAYFYNGDLIISESGKYVISGTLTDGSIIVDAHKSSKVWLLLNGVDLNCTDDACLRIDKADKVFLTLAEGSENSMSSGTKYSDEALADKTGGVIFAHDDLTINGSGLLTLYAAYKHGIDANDELVITGGKINITAVQDAVHVNDGFCFTNGELVISAGDDGIHSETSIYIESGSIKILSCYEGLEAVTIDIAGGDILIYPEDDGLNANGNKRNAFGMGGLPGMQQQTTSEYSSAAEEETWVHISGGSLSIINENGNDADGIDSNGDILITGGSIRVSLVNRSTNSALDYGSESGGTCIIHGGEIVACGSYTMAEGFENGSGQCSIMYNLSSDINAGTEIILEDTEGNVLLSYEVPCSFSSVVLSCPEMQLGETYIIVIGDNEDKITLEETAASYGDAQSTKFFGSMNWGSMRPPQDGTGFGRDRRGSREEDGQRQERNDFDNEVPKFPEAGYFNGEISDISDMPQPPDMGNFSSNFPQMPERDEFDSEMLTFPAPDDFNGGEPDMSIVPQVPDSAADEPVQSTAAETQTTAIDSRETFLLSVLSVVVLLAGILITRKFKK